MHFTLKEISKCYIKPTTRVKKSSRPQVVWEDVPHTGSSRAESPHGAELGPVGFKEVGAWQSGGSVRRSVGRGVF